MSRLLVPVAAAEIRFPADRFAPTQHDSAAAKARFANHYVRFVATGFDRALFQPWFYRRLSMSFGHIAHRNLDGFYNSWFERTFDQYVFVERALRCRCFGDPAFTYCDVEAALRSGFRPSAFWMPLRACWRSSGRRANVPSCTGCSPSTAFPPSSAVPAIRSSAALRAGPHDQAGLRHYRQPRPPSRACGWSRVFDAT
jgi:hypothetical protein